LKIWRKFFFNSEVSILLDSITVINQYLGEHFPDSLSKHWLSRVNRIFTEEHLAYRVEEEGIVRPFVDEEFQVNRATALDASAEKTSGTTMKPSRSAIDRGDRKLVSSTKGLDTPRGQRHLQGRTRAV